jgi:hypothetical protein
MKTKTLWWSVVSILIIGIVAGMGWWTLRSQTITFSSGAKLTLVAVEYGKKHAQPNVKTPAGTRARRGNSFTTPNDTLVLWVRQEYDSKEWHNFQYCVYDKADTACVQTYGRNYGNGRQGNEIVAVQLDAFPRRQGKFYLRVQENSNGGQEMSDQKFVIRNPARGSSAKWYPDALPNTQSDDDLEVTLTKLVFGAGTIFNRDQDNPDDPVNKGVAATYRVERNGKPVTNWQSVSVETTDATGNHVNGWCNTQWNGDEGVTTYQWGLWPDEPAWKIRFEFSQQSDFTDNELWTVKNIPLQPGRQQDFWNYNNRRNNTNSVFAETDLNGFHLKIFPATQFTDQQQGNGQINGGLRVQATPSLPAGMRLTLAKVTDNQGQEIQSYNFGTSGDGRSTTCGYQLRDIGDATNLNFTVALHKSRFVEFTAKPEKAAAAQ